MNFWKHATSTHPGRPVTTRHVTASPSMGPRKPAPQALPVDRPAIALAGLPAAKRWAGALSFARLALLGTSARSTSRPPASAKPSTPPPKARVTREEAALDAVAAQRERERCQAIVMHPAASKNFALAKVLAFHTRLSRGAAIEQLEAEANGTGTFSHLRGARFTATPPRPTQAAINASWDASFQRTSMR